MTAESAHEPQDAARWRAIVRSAVDAIIVIDVRGRIELFNPAAERIFGYDSSEVLGRNVAMLMPEPHAAQHDGYLDRYVTTGVRRIIGIGRDVEGHRKDGTVFPAHLSVGEFAIDGETKFTGIVRDLTDRVNLERTLREEAGFARIGELATILAHEVRNPLAAVSGAMQILSQKLPTKEDRDVIEEALLRLDGLSAMMTDLLLYARPPKPRFASVDVRALVESLLTFLRMDPAWREIDSRVDGLVPPVLADAELLKVAMQNLLLNALQAMHGRGRLAVSMRHGNGLVHIDVIDSGSGISPEAHLRLFTPFFTTKARGTGLGLATVKRVALAHHGDITVVTTGATGTTIRLSIPTEDQAPRSPVRA